MNLTFIYLEFTCAAKIRLFLDAHNMIDGDRLDAWRESGVTTLVLQTREREALRALAELV